MSERVVLKRGARGRVKPARTKRKAATRKSAAAKRRGAASEAKKGWLAPLLALTAATAALFAAWLYQLPDRLWLAAAHGVAAAGFEVRDVNVTGAREMQRLPLYTAALDGASDSMLLVDLDDVKARLENLPWVEEASVGRALPDTLNIDIVERVPAAVWQNEGRHRLIDAEGRVLAADDLKRFAHLPLVVDEGANGQAGALVAILRDYPALAEHFASATWRGGRRWDMSLKSGEMLLLPEGEANVRQALDDFVRLERRTGLLGRGFVTLDFRVPGQMAVRVSREPGAAFEELQGTEI